MKPAKNFKGLEKASLESIRDQLESGGFTSEVLVKVQMLTRGPVAKSTDIQA